MSSAEELKAAKRQISIKTGVVKRLTNEHKSYQTETEQQKAVVDRLVAKEGSDEWDVQNSKKVLADCEQMIEPARKRAQEAIAQLQDVLAMAESEPEVLASEEVTKAKDLLASITTPSS